MGRIDGVTTTGYVFKHYSYMKHCQIFEVNMKILQYDFKQKLPYYRVQTIVVKIAKILDQKKSTKTGQCHLKVKNITISIMWTQ